MTPRTFAEATEVLKASIPNYEDRPEQSLLATAIESAIRDDEPLIGQGGCGVGKSFASLVPAILSGKRVVYSTATKALQEQIASKDLPFLAEHFPTTYAVLKGRSNYLCMAKLAEVEENGQMPVGFRDAVMESSLGERDELPVVDNNLWSNLTIASDECPGRQACPFGDVCFAEKARAEALAAQVVVVNHALLATDAVVRNATDNSSTMIGAYDTLIVDEAHELEEFVSSALSVTYRQSTITHFATELRNFAHRVSHPADEVLSSLNVASEELFTWLPLGRLRQSTIVNNVEYFEAMIAAYSEASAWITSDDLSEALAQMEKSARQKARNTRERLRRRVNNALSAFLSSVLDTDGETVRFVEEVRKGSMTFKSLSITPIAVDGWLRRNLWNSVSPILISATILIDGKADFIAGRLGVDHYVSVDAGSPFDYKRQARLYIPKHLPTPSGNSVAEWSLAAISEMENLVKASDGRALLLFTSRKEMNAAWTALVESGTFDAWPTKKQGDEPNSVLMSWFKSNTKSVLFALKSFFTGIDVQGESLSLVVINKLPFPVPTEPLFEARSELIKSRGGNDFAELTIPSMTLPLQQAAGRLIRTKTDTGVIAILDPRICTKVYGSSIRRSLPSMPMIHSHSEVQWFFDQENNA